MSILAVTGCDGVGKSTLVTELSKALGYETKHFDKPKDMEDGKKQYFEFAKDMNNDPSKNIICDRLHEGEWVYAPLYRGYTADYMREFEREIVKKHNYLQVYVKAELDTIIERTRKRGEDFVKEEHFKTVLDYFDKYMNEMALPYIEIDTTNSKTEDDIKKIIDAFNKVNFIWDLFRNGSAPGVITIPVFPRGNVFGEVMVVAQNPGGRGIRDYSTVWSDGPNSKFLIEAIKEAGIYRNTWFTNLVPYPTPDNKVTNEQIEATEHILYAQVELLKPKVLIGLGSISSNYLKENFGKDIKVIELAHPAYVRRFLSGDSKNREKWVKQMQEAKKYF